MADGDLLLQQNGDTTILSTARMRACVELLIPLRMRSMGTTERLQATGRADARRRDAPKLGAACTRIHKKFLGVGMVWALLGLPTRWTVTSQALISPPSERSQ